MHRPVASGGGLRRSRWRWALPVAAVALGAAACGTTKAPLSARAERAKPAAGKPAPGQPAVTAGGGSSCASAQWAPTVYGTPHISRDPTIEAVTVTPNFGGLLVSYRFKKPFKTAPSGVYDAWTIFVFQHRSDAGNLESAVQLQIEDRGAGWEPSGWTLLATLGTTNNQVEGNVRTNKAGNVIQTFFPAGFADLRPPFFWYAEQVQDRAYLPRNDRADFNVNGTITSDCPNGVMGPSGVPEGSRLIEVKD